jgi:prephenate dehydratase
MPLSVNKAEVWACQVSDQPGALADRLAPLAAAGVDLTFLVARRAPESPGTGVVFVAGIRGAKQTKAAAAAGFTKSLDVTALYVVGPNKPGAVQKITSALAAGGINLRGACASTVGNKFGVSLGFDSAADAAAAAKLIKKLK